MSNYPTASQLKTKFAQKLSTEQQKNDQFVTALAEKFAGQKISCNHRVPQRATFELAQSMNVDPEVASACAETLCAFVDESSCNK